MPRGKKSPVKRKTRKTSPRRRVSPKRRVRKTSPTRKTRKTFRGRKKMSVGGSIKPGYVDFGTIPSSRNGNYGDESTYGLAEPLDDVDPASYGEFEMEDPNFSKESIGGHIYYAPLPPDPVRRIGSSRTRLPPLPPDPVRRIGSSRTGLPPLPPDPVRRIGSSRRRRQRGTPLTIEVPGGDLIPFSRQTAFRYARDGFPVVYAPGENSFMVADMTEHTDQELAFVTLIDGRKIKYDTEEVATYAYNGFILEEYNFDFDNMYRYFKLKYIKE